MLITAPETFRHVGSLTARDVGVDPRRAQFLPERFDIDLRACQFVLPAAVLWCATYPAMMSRRGVPTRLLVPENQGTSIYLQSVGLFDALKRAGVAVDDRGIGHRVDPQIILPLADLNSEFEVERLANVARSAHRISHVMKTIEKRDQIVGLSRKILGSRNFEFHAGGVRPLVFHLEG